MRDFLKFVESMYHNLSKEERMVRLEFLVKQDVLPDETLIFSEAEKWGSSKDESFKPYHGDVVVTSIKIPNLPSGLCFDGTYYWLLEKDGTVKRSRDGMYPPDGEMHWEIVYPAPVYPKTEIAEEPEPSYSLKFKQGDKVRIRKDVCIETRPWAEGLKGGDILTILEKGGCAYTVQENSKLWYEDWLELADSPKFKPGDKVRITERCRDYAERLGWKALPRLIGKIEVIESVDRDGIIDEITGKINYTLMHSNCHWPDDCLELVNE